MTILNFFLNTMIRNIKIQKNKLSHYSFKFYRTWVMYSRKQINENISLSISSKSNESNKI